MKKYKNFVTEAGRCWPGHKPVPGKKPFTPGSCVKEEVLEEGRPSQRHPLEGHDYHKKTDDELKYIAKDAHEAAEAMKSHNTTAENKYRDQANDSATVRYWRQKHGMPDWYKKKYGHIKEEIEQIDELSKKTIKSYANKKQAELDDVPPMPFKKPAKSKAETEKAAKGMMGALARLSGRKPTSESVAEEAEQIDELRTSTLLRYQTKANKALIGGDRNKEEKRIKGIQTANYKIQSRHKVKEEAELDEAMRSGFDYERAARAREQMKAKGFEPGSRPYTWKRIATKPQEPQETPEKKNKDVNESAAWQRKEGKNPEGGLNRKGIASYRRENPGSKLSMAVTTPPSKLKPGSKAANRRKSFCARMGGMPGPMKDEKGRPTRKALSLKKWNC